jgi:four helix bundle protein
MAIDDSTGKERDLKIRTRQFAVRVIRLVDSLKPSRSTEVIGKQLLRCGTSVGANYRAACRGRSKAEFLAKLGIVEEEADECVFWMQLLIDAGLVKPEVIDSLMSEANELTAIVVASMKTAKSSR